MRGKRNSSPSWFLFSFFFSSIDLQGNRHRARINTDITLSNCTQQEQLLATLTKARCSEEGCLRAVGLSCKNWNCLVAPVSLDSIGREFLLTPRASNSHTVLLRQCAREDRKGCLKPGHDPVGVYCMRGSLMCLGKIASVFP